jgi:hypothetical protein
MFAYSREPIDFWPGWLTETEFKSQLESRYESEGDQSGAWARYGDFRAKAEAAAKKIGWEGDMREGPFVAGLPGRDGEGDGQIMIAWKQDNNGLTLIVSPYKLPWLD